VQVARATASTERILGRLRWLLAAGLIGALGLSGLVVWLAAGRAAAPLGRLAQTAETVGTSGDLSRRVDVSGSEDEVGHLAATFNTMLQRLERTDADLRAARVRAEEALDAQRRFVADASHELRTPLTTIRGNADLLRDYGDVTPSDRAAALTQIQQESERMSRLVNDLLTLARADAGQPLAREPVPLGALLGEVAAQARVLARGQQVSLAVASDATVLGDADSLRQFLLILLDNALRHTPEGGSVELRLEEQSGDALVSVRDTGEGIAPADLPHIFERFYRADRARSGTGVGLGLAIARWIVREHGGEIEVSSSLGEGSIFSVRLPLAIPAPAPRPAPIPDPL
jgi:signal transduction histidine kinase